MTTITPSPSHTLVERLRRLDTCAVSDALDKLGLTFLPLLLFGLRGGELADRADRRKILLVTNAALGVLAAFAAAPEPVARPGGAPATTYRPNRTAAFQTPDQRHLYGLLPPTISHEGYSDKAAYSYWDDFWGLLGYKDAVFIAETLGLFGKIGR